VAEWSKALNVSARSKNGTVGSNPIPGMVVSLHLFRVCVVRCRQRPVTGSSPVQGVLPIIYKIQISRLNNSEWAQGRDPDPSMQKKKQKLEFCNRQQFLIASNILYMRETVFSGKQFQTYAVPCNNVPKDTKRTE
jgi:hypothetical protein